MIPGVSKLGSAGSTVIFFSWSPTSKLVSKSSTVDRLFEAENFVKGKYVQIMRICVNACKY